MRNYEGVANFAANDKAEFMRLKTGRENAEKEREELKRRAEMLEAQNGEMRPMIEGMNGQINELKNKND